MTPWTANTAIVDLKTKFLSQKLKASKNNVDYQMPEKSACINVPKTDGQTTIVIANSLGIVNKKLQVKGDEQSVYIPIVRKPTDAELKEIKRQLPNVKVSTSTFMERPERKVSIVQALEGKLPPHLLASLPRAMDVVGDIAIVEIPEELEAHKSTVGKAVLQMNKNLRAVLAKIGAVSGEYRVREFSMIAGEPKTFTLHKEHGCVYHVDLAKVYFSPRLSFEHNRVASLVEPDETVVDLFAGVGPFSVLIAKKQPHAKVYAVDANTAAFEFLKKNVRVNRVEDRVFPILGDARQVVRERLAHVADRVIMNLPEKALEFVDVACQATALSGGVIHFYSFVKASEPMQNLHRLLKESVEECGRKVERILESRFVRETAPYEWQAVIDAELR
jgi:tRNA (guanine37-N1)-methyltransferase